MLTVRPPPSEVDAGAEALFREARHRARRRIVRRLIVAAVSVVALLGIVAAVAISSVGEHSGKESRVPLRPGPGKLPREGIQFRPVLETSATSCKATDVKANPQPNQTISLLGPLTGPLPGVLGKTGPSADPGCALLGPAVLTASKISAIQLGRSPADRVTVGIFLNASEDVRLRSMTVSHPTKFYAVVALGQVLSYPTGSQLSAIGSSGQFQVAGRLSPADRRPSELAQVLHTSLDT